jgi:hypothetical protein
LFPLSCLLVLCLHGDQELTLRTSVHVVAVSIVATDSAGAPAEGLGAHDFRVRDNGKAQKEEEDARLESLLLESLAGGADIPLTRAFRKDLRAEARDIASRHKPRKRA